MNSTKSLARVAGLLYLIVAIGGAFSELFVRSSVKVPGNAAATVSNIVAHTTLFRAGFVADLVDVTCFLGVGLVLYAILRPVNPPVAVAMLALNAVSVAVQGLNMLNHLGALLVATDHSYTAGLSPQTANALAMFFLDMHYGYLVAQIFFGLYLLPLGYLVYKSGSFPRILGIVLMIGCVGYVAEVPAVYLSPNFQSGVALSFGTIGGLAELMFLLWLLIVGANVPRPEGYAMATEPILAARQPHAR